MAQGYFPHPAKFKIGSRELSAQQVIDVLSEFLTPERQAKVAKVVEERTYAVVPVLEDIYDRGNTSAVLRSAEAMGFQAAHIIELGEKFKSSNRVTSGADKWLDVVKWKSTRECVEHLKSKGYRVLATHLDAKAKPIEQIDFSTPVAWVLGNEKEGISKEMQELADETVIIPMNGFVQSFNISVAGAISFYHIHRERIRLFGKNGDLTDEQKLILKAQFYLRTPDSPEQLIEKYLSRT